MPRNTGVDILSIKPDSDLGLAQDTNIPVPAVALDQINKANQDIRDYDHQRQLMKYDHQLKQRDQLLKGLDAGEISTKAILPEDRAFYKEKEDAVRKAFLEVTSMEPDEKGNNVAMDKYHQAKQDLQDASTMLQSRYVLINKKRADRAATNLPSEQAAYDKEINYDLHELDKMQPVRPFQKVLTLDTDYLDGIAAKGGMWQDDNGNPVVDESTTTKVTTNDKGTTVQKTTAPVKPVVKNGKVTPVPASTEVGPDGKLPIFTTTPGKKYDYRGVMAKMYDAYNNPADEKATVMMDKQLEMFQGTEDPEAQAIIALRNQNLARMDQQNGIPTIKVYDKLNRVGPPSDNPNDPVGKVIDTGIYPSEINHRFVGNKLIIEEPAPVLAAKMAAGKESNFVEEGQKLFNEKNFELNLKSAENKADILLKGAQAQAHRARGAFYYKKIAGMNADKEQEKVINDGYKYNLTTQQNLAIPVGNGYSLAQIPGNKTTPIFTWASGKDGAAAKPVIIKPIGSKPIYGTDPKNTATHGKVIGYEGGHYDQQYIYGGQPQSATSLWKMYQKFKTDTPAWNKGFDDYLKEAINADYFDVKIIGENGSTDRNVHTQALKAISNAASKKGQDQPFYESFNENE